jgi:tRNA(Ile)-lysidine synthetase-like protein
MSNIDSILSRYIKSDTICCLAVSGWPDSMYMATQVIAHYQKQWYALCQLCIISIDHGVRTQSQQEVEQVRLYFSQYPDIVVYTHTLQTDNHTESHLRKLRWKYFEMIMHKTHAHYLVTGHNLTDRFETLLLNLCRGCHLQGMINMTEVDTYILRPVIHMSKDHIRLMCDQMNIPYWIDYTNIDPTISLRNRIRSSVGEPLYRIADKYNGTAIFDHSLDQMFTILESAQDMIHDSDIVFESIPLSPYHTWWRWYHIQNHHMIDSIQDIYHILKKLWYCFNWSQNTLHELLKFVKHTTSGSKQYWDMKRYKSHGCLYIVWWINDSLIDFETTITTHIYQLWMIMFGPYQFDIQQSKRIWFTIRYSQIWDIFHSKTFSKICINRKIPVFWRSYIPVIVDSNDKIVAIIDHVRKKNIPIVL